MKNLFKFTIGDDSGDGYNITEEFIFWCSHSGKEATEAFERGTRILGTDIMDICNEFEDNTVPHEVMEKLRDNGFTEQIDFYSDIYTIGPNNYVDMLKFVIQLGNPEILFEDTAMTGLLNTGYSLGYGLF